MLLSTSIRTILLGCIIMSFFFVFLIVRWFLF